MKDLISVIVPIYKVEPYLDKCISSIVNQTYTNLEIILVDDGSPDNCPAMCDSWAKKDSRIRVIHKANGGAASARNAGMKYSSGSIISFVDSDDIIHNEMYSMLIKAMEETGCEIVQCDLSYFESNIATVDIDVNSNIQYDTYSTTEALSLLISDKKIRQTPPNKIYRRRVISAIEWPEERAHEDEFWTYKAIGQSNAICCVNEPMYFYRQHAQSVMHKPFNFKSLDCMEAIKERYMYIVDNYPELTTPAYQSLFGSILYSCQCALKLQDTSERNLCLKRIFNCYQFFCQQPVMISSMKDRIWFYMSHISLKFTGHIRNFLKVGV